MLIHVSHTFLQPEVDVCLSVEQPLLTETQIKECNLMALTVESLYSPPDAWTLAGAQYVYTSTLPMPVTSEVSLDLYNPDLPEERVKK